MKLIPNWKEVVMRSHSMWSLYASFACLVTPELIYWIAGIDTNPRLWWIFGLALLIYGILGRLKDQGIDRSKTQSPWIVGLFVLIAVVLIWNGDWRERTTGVEAPAVTDARPTLNPQPNVTPDAAFLDVAVPFVGKWEGLRLVAYQDVVGVWTVCYGETKGVRPGDSYTKAECDAMFSREILAYQTGLHKHFTAKTIADRLPVPRDVAFTSLAYNVGVSGAGKSTATRRLNKGDVFGACTALTWWNKAGGRVIRGLARRRADEYALCMQGVA